MDGFFPAMIVFVEVIPEQNVPTSTRLSNYYFFTFVYYLPTVYYNEERIEIFVTYYRNKYCVNAVVRIFNTNHPDHNVSHQFVLQLVDKFRISDFVHNRKHELFCMDRNEAFEVAVLVDLQIDNRQSLRNVAKVSGATSVFLIVKDHKFHFFKIRAVLKLNENNLTNE